MIHILQAFLVMLATVVSTLVESTDLPSVPEDSKHMVTLEGSEPLPNPDARHRYATHQLPHGAVSCQPRAVYVTTTERHCAPTTVTRTVNISPTLVPEVPELPEDYCNGPGQFLFGATNECFLYLKDGLRSFEDADTECRKGGMRLAKPKNPKALQKHLVTVLGHSGHVWLGARGDGHSFKWQTNDGASIRNTDPNWWTGMPANYITNDHCLVLVAYPNGVKQEKVFYPESCSLKRTALCQREECSPQCSIGNCEGYNTCVYDPSSEEHLNMTDNESDGDGNTDGRPKGTPDGLFYFAPSDQWLYFTNISYERRHAWNTTYEYCTSIGLEMAKPKDPIKLMKYLNDNYGFDAKVIPLNWQMTWLGARGTGSDAKWIRDGERITSSDPLFYRTIRQEYFDPAYCLALFLGESYYESFANKPLAMRKCDETYRILCEYVKKENS